MGQTGRAGKLNESLGEETGDLAVGKEYWKYDRIRESEKWNRMNSEVW